MADRERVEALAKVVEQHDAITGPISGYWTCACGVQSDNTRASKGGPTPDDRRATYRQHLAEMLTNSSAMRDLLADVWDEGEDAGYGGARTGMGSGDNPYRAHLANATPTEPKEGDDE